MAVKIKVFTIFEKKVWKKFRKKSVLSPIADELVTMIKVRTRKGYGVKEEGSSQEKFVDFEASTLKSRARLKKQGKLMSGVGAKRNALSASGQLVDSVSQKTRTGQSELFLKENRDDGLSNNELKDWHEKGISSKRGPKKRPFFHVSDKEEKKVKNLVRKEIKEIIRKL